MIYYQRNQKILEEFHNLEDKSILMYPDVLDVRNFAFSIIYENSEEQFLRTPGLRNHFLGLKLLYKKSKYLKQYVTFLEVSQEDHVDCDYSLVRQGNMLFYHYNSSCREDYVGGFLYLPSRFSTYQQQWLLKSEKYLLSYADIGIYQYVPELEILLELSVFGEENYQNVLKNVLKKFTK